MVSNKWFRSRILLFYIFLLLLSLVGFWGCFKFAHPSLTIFPEGHSSHEWSLTSWNDQHSEIRHEKNTSSIVADIKLSDASPWFGAGISINFDKNAGQVFDFSSFNVAKLSLKCMPANTLYFGVSLQDEKVTQVGVPLTYRNAGTHINCDTELREVVVKLDALEVPIWWLHQFGFKASENKYDLKKVIRVYLEAGRESPVGVDSKLYVSEISFSGRREGVLLNFTLALFSIWILSGAWTIRCYLKVRPLEKEVLQSLKYEPLDFNPARERDKQAVLDYIAKNFANTEIDSESVSKGAGVSRTRVTEILKSEYGSSFTNYINKLRLFEASRLLAEKPDAHITEIAYLVGFKNISYFNKLFKEEFGLTPKEVRGKGSQS